MVDSLIPSIEATVGESSSESRRKKPRISETDAAEIETRRINEENLKRWKTNRVQQIYSSKLFEALRRIRQRSTTTTSTESDKTITGVAREIRETADRVLAASARGTTRWSRAILTSKMKKHRKAAKKSIGNCKSRKATTDSNRSDKLPAVQRKLKTLGRLVPGCRKISVTNLLDEATDYVAALQMQIRAMEALAELLATAAPPPPTTTLTGP